jgi:hypothetical protein
MGSRVFNILNTVATQHDTPMRFGVGVILIQDTLISGQCFVKLIQSPEVVAPVEKIDQLIVTGFGQSRSHATGITRSKRRAFCRLYVTAAHFTLECHRRTASHDILNSILK